MKRPPILLLALLLATAITACEGTPTDTATGLSADQAVIAAQQGSPPNEAGPPEDKGPPEGKGPPPGRGPGFFSTIAFASDRGGTFDIFVMDGDGSNPVQLTESFEASFDPAWSPDGTKIAFAGTGRDNEIWVMDADGSEPTVLSPISILCKRVRVVEGPAWSPDETRIAFARTCFDGFDIFVMDAGGNSASVLTSGAANTDPTWSPDGLQIAFASDRSGHDEIWVMDPDGSDQTFLGPSSSACPTENPDAREPAWSPDGARIAFAFDCDGNFDIYVMDSDGSNLVQLTDDPADDVEPAWSPDGRGIAFVSDRTGNDDVWVMNADGSLPKNLTAGSTASDVNPSWQP